MAKRGSQKPVGSLAVAPNSLGGSAAPHSERTLVSADVPDRAKPSTNRASGRAAVPDFAPCAAGRRKECLSTDFAALRRLVAMASATLHVLNWFRPANGPAV